MRNVAGTATLAGLSILIAACRAMPDRPLTQAAARGDTQAVISLISQGADASAPDDLKLAGGGDDLPRHLRLTADDEGVIAVDSSAKLLRREPGADVYLSPKPLQVFDAILGYGVADQDTRGHAPRIAYR